MTTETTVKRTIWKFPFTVKDIVEIEMPMGAWILKVDAQHERPCIWALADPDAELEQRRFRVVGTGHPCDDVSDFQHVGTFQQFNETLVWHVFDMRVSP